VNCLHSLVPADGEPDIYQIRYSLVLIVSVRIIAAVGHDDNVAGGCFMELKVLEYLTKDTFVFVNPQYSIKDEKGKEWSCPDLVALNFRDRLVFVIEVSTGWKTKRLQEKVQHCDKQWIDKLRAQLLKLKVIDDSWNFEVQVFVRKHAIRAFTNIIQTGTKVRVVALETLGESWEWPRG